MPKRTDPVASPDLPLPCPEEDGLVPLSRAAVGRRRVITRLDGPARDELEREGLLSGTVVVVIGRTPLGGPVIVQLGRTRLALSVNVAAQVMTGPDTGSRQH